MGTTTKLVCVLWLDLSSDFWSIFTGDQHWWYNEETCVSEHFHQQVCRDRKQVIRRAGNCIDSYQCVYKQQTWKQQLANKQTTNQTSKEIMVRSPWILWTCVNKSLIVSLGWNPKSLRPTMVIGKGWASQNGMVQCPNGWPSDAIFLWIRLNDEMLLASSTQIQPDIMSDITGLTVLFLNGIFTYGGFLE